MAVMLAKDLQFQVFKSVDGPEGYISPQSILVFISIRFPGDRLCWWVQQWTDTD